MNSLDLVALVHGRQQRVFKILGQVVGIGRSRRVEKRPGAEQQGQGHARRCRPPKPAHPQGQPIRRRAGREQGHYALFKRVWHAVARRIRPGGRDQFPLQ